MAGSTRSTGPSDVPSFDVPDPEEAFRRQSNRDMQNTLEVNDMENEAAEQTQTTQGSVSPAINHNVQPNESVQNQNDKNGSDNEDDEFEEELTQHNIKSHDSQAIPPQEPSRRTPMAELIAKGSSVRKTPISDNSQDSQNPSRPVKSPIAEMMESGKTSRGARVTDNSPSSNHTMDSNDASLDHSTVEVLKF